MSKDVVVQASGGVVPRMADATEATGEPSFVVFDRPDWVTYPEPVAQAVGVGRGNVVDAFEKEYGCPMCLDLGVKRVLVTEHGIIVIACAKCGQYAWVRKPK